MRLLGGGEQTSGRGVEGGVRRVGGLIVHAIITATLPLKGWRLQVKAKSIKDACATHVNVCADMTLNSAMKRTQSLHNSHILPPLPPLPAISPGLSLYNCR